MRKVGYTVYKHLNTDRDFQAYVDLLREKNVDVSRLERIREKGAERKWLYAWPSRELAEQFAQELRIKLRDSEWKVVEFEPESSPAGIEVEVQGEQEGRTYRLTDDSLVRIKELFPGTNAVPSIYIANHNLASYEQQFGSIEDQIIILLTSLSSDQIERLGGVTFRQFNRETLNPSAYETAPSEYEAQAKTTAQLIDQLASDQSKFSELLTLLVSLTLPEQPWNSEIEINPFRGNIEAQCWFWNRAGSLLFKYKRFRDAAELFAAQYFSTISLQNLFGHRYHKGMSLCNLGIAFSYSGELSLAKQSWILGLIEDSVTNRSTASKLNNYRNMMNYVKNNLHLDSIIDSADHLVRGLNIVPVLPESIVIQCLDPLQQAASKASLQAMQGLLRDTNSAFPGLFSGPYITRAKELWDQMGIGSRLDDLA